MDGTTAEHVTALDENTVNLKLLSRDAKIKIIFLLSPHSIHSLDWQVTVQRLKEDPAISDWYNMKNILLARTLPAYYELGEVSQR